MSKPAKPSRAEIDAVMSKWWHVEFDVKGQDDPPTDDPWKLIQWLLSGEPKAFNRVSIRKGTAPNEQND